jgi:hypothetical protein
MKKFFLLVIFTDRGYRTQQAKKWCFVKRCQESRVKYMKKGCGGVAGIINIKNKKVLHQSIVK